MKHPNEKRFEDFFAENKYVVLKNYLYSYLVRKRAIKRAIRDDKQEIILEIGSGLSPMVTDVDNIVYSELSLHALRTLKRRNRRGFYVVADGTRLPFKTDSFSHTICSEVLEHVEDDQLAIHELARVMKSPGHACITVPHRRFYFTADDRYVGHFRRYEIDEMEGKLHNAGLHLFATKKVLGPLDKLTALQMVVAFEMIRGIIGTRTAAGTSSGFTNFVAPVFRWMNLIYSLIAQIDARVMPRALSTVILFEADKPAGKPK